MKECIWKNTYFKDNKFASERNIVCFKVWKYKQKSKFLMQKFGDLKDDVFI